MKFRSVLILFLVGMLLGSCEARSSPAAPTVSGASFVFFRDGYYQVVIPDWQEIEKLSPDAIFSIQQEGQFIVINRYQTLPELFSKQFKSYIEESPDAYLVQEKELACISGRSQTVPGKFTLMDNHDR